MSEFFRPSGDSGLCCECGSPATTPCGCGSAQVVLNIKQYRGVAQHCGYKGYNGSTQRFRKLLLEFDTSSEAIYTYLTTPDGTETNVVAGTAVFQQEWETAFGSSTCRTICGNNVIHTYNRSSPRPGVSGGQSQGYSCAGQLTTCFPPNPSLGYDFGRRASCRGDGGSFTSSFGEEGVTGVFATESAGAEGNGVFWSCSGGGFVEQTLSEPLTREAVINEALANAQQEASLVENPINLAASFYSGDDEPTGCPVATYFRLIYWWENLSHSTYPNVRVNWVIEDPDTGSPHALLSTTITSGRSSDFEINVDPAATDIARAVGPFTTTIL